MLRGEGNEDGEKTKIGLISKKATLHVQHTFFYISLPLFSKTTTWNFQKLPTYTFYSGTVVRVFVHFFSLPLIFTLVAASISHFHRRCEMFLLFFQQKMTPLFLSLALALCRPFSFLELRWPAARFLFFSVFLFLYIPNLWTWHLI